MNYSGFAVLKEGDFMAVTCCTECAEYIIDELTVMRGEYSYTARSFPEPKECAACGEMIPV